VPSPPRFIVKCGHLNTENFTSGDFFHFFYRLNVKTEREASGKPSGLIRHFNCKSTIRSITTGCSPMRSSE
jgi:hypothetical protein